MIVNNKRTSLYLILLILTALGLRFIALNQSFWLDEAAQAMISINPFTPGHFNGDFQPPLSYYLTFVWMNIGQLIGERSEWFLRLPMVGFGVGTVFLLYRMLSDMFDSRVGLTAGLMLATAPFHIYYSQEMRMYSMLTCISVFSWYMLYKRQWKWLAITTTIGIFTHYFMFINLAAQAVYIFVTHKRDVQKFSLAVSLGVVPFVLWLPTFMNQLETARRLMQAWPGWENISNTGFIRFPGLVLAKFTVGLISPEPRLLYGASVAAFASVLLLSAGALIAHFIKKASASDKQNVMLITSMFALPLIFAWIGGIFISASSPWRIQFVLPALYAIIAYGAWTLRNKYPIIMMAIIVYVVIQNLFFTSQYLFVADNHREDWKSAVAFTDERAREDYIILSEYVEPWAPMQWYTTQEESYTGSSTQQRITPKSIDEQLKDIVTTYDSIALYTYLFEISDPEKQVDAYLKEKGYTLINEKDFRGVGIINLYTR